MANRIEIDYDLFEKYVNNGNTETAIASFFNISEDTLSRRVKEKYGVTFADYIKKGAFHLHDRIRTAILRSAEGEKDDNGKWVIYPNVTAQIFLCKAILGMAENSGNNEQNKEPITIIYKVNDN